MPKDNKKRTPVKKKTDTAFNLKPSKFTNGKKDKKKKTKKT